MKKAPGLRFSLRAFLALLTLACVAFGLITAQARRQESAIAWIRKHGGKYYDWNFSTRTPNTRATVPRALRWMMGEHFFLRVNLVELYGNKVETLAPLANLHDLEQVVLERANVRDLTALGRLPKLRELDLNGNAIEDLRPLASLATLEVLYLADNHVADLRPLASLSRLKWLRLDGNRVVDVTPLAGLASLRSLDLSRNQIIDCAPLKSLANLNFVDLTKNRASDAQLNALRASMPKLDYWNGVRVKTAEY